LIPIKVNSKIPALTEWRHYQTQAPTQAEVAEWKARFPGCNWAMLTGRASGIVVLDVDVRHNGMDSLNGLVIPCTRTILTQGGGWHYYFVCPPQGCRTVPSILPGVDLKADGGYVLIPPSSIDGNPYEVAVDAMVFPMPAWLVAKAFPQSADRRTRRTPSSEWVELLRGVGEGERNATCTRLAGWLLGHGIEHLAFEGNGLAVG